MPVGTLAEARVIAYDVATILDQLAAELDARADRALEIGRRDDATELRRRIEEVTRQAERLRGI